jgi:DUF1009 family protein
MDTPPQQIVGENSGLKAAERGMSQVADKYGLIAGNGSFPFMVLESARNQDISVVVAAIKEETFPEIESCGFEVHWLGLGQLGKLIRLFKQSGVNKAIMAGQVKHTQIFSSSIPDFTMIRMLAGLKRKNTDSLIGAVAGLLKEAGIELVDSTELIKPHMAPVGPLTRRGLNAREQADVDYARPVAQRIAQMDIGQTVVVRDRAIVAVEAMEGTDAAIRRAGQLVNNRDLTVIKVSKPNQDMRFDVPVIGKSTIQVMIEAGATALTLDAHKTLLMERSTLAELADDHGIAVVGFPPDE